ncbi:MAG: mercuric transport protein MerTP [Chitinophagaceae bacterium]
MKTNRSSVRLIGLGILTAIAASLCCITPVLALIAGSAGIASTFSWLEPARPYLAGLTIIVLAFAWYRQLKPKKEGDVSCACETDEGGNQMAKKLNFWKSKTFLSIITVLSLLLLAFPYYSKVFFPKETPQVIIVQSNNIKQAHLKITGMDCVACEKEVKHAVAQLPGFMDASVAYQSGKATVKFDQSKTSLQMVDSAVNSSGFTVIIC